MRTYKNNNTNMFRKFIKKVIKEYIDENSEGDRDQPKKDCASTGYLEEQVRDLNEKMRVLLDHLNLHMSPHFNHFKYKVEPRKKVGDIGNGSVTAGPIALSK